MISFRMDWLDLLAVQGTLKSLLQHHSSKGSVLWHSAFFIVQLSHPSITTGKTIALTRRTSVHQWETVIIIYPLPLEPSFSLLPHTSRLSRDRSGLPALYSSLSLVIYFTHGSVYISILLSQFALPSPSQDF